MKKTLLTTLVATMLATSAAWACDRSDPTCLSTGAISTSINITGGGAAIVNQTGPGTSSADFSTTAGGFVDGSTSVVENSDPLSGSVTTNATINGAAWSTTTGVVEGTGYGMNYSNSNVSGDASVDGSVTFGDELNGGSLDAGSSVAGSAGAGSAVEINNLDGSLGTGPIEGYSYQEAAFNATNTSNAAGNIGEADEYCEVPSEVNLYLSSVGSTATSADGILTGEGASGASGAFASETGYARGDVNVANEYIDVNLSGDLGGLMNDGEISSYSAATNADGETYSDAGSASDVYVNQEVDITVDECCVPTVVVRVEDGKYVEGTVYTEEGVAGGGVTVTFETNIETNVDLDGDGGDNGGPGDDEEGANNGYGNGADGNPPGFDNSQNDNKGQDD